MKIELYGERADKVIAKTEYCGPHCDHRILHPRDICESCSMPEWDELHSLRNSMKIRYTGESITDDWDIVGDYHPCPSEIKRDLKTIYKWSRNRPKKEEI